MNGRVATEEGDSQRARDKGRLEDIVKAARSMKADGLPVEQIAKYTCLTAEEIETL